jgi:thiol-disulfide isomerase/thioredoxin
MARTPTTFIPLGFSAPDFELPDVVSGELMNDDRAFSSGPTVVVFMCNHCPFVVHILEQFVSFARAYGERGVGFVAISSNDVKSHPLDGIPHMKALAEAMNFSFPYLFDETQDVARAFDAACTPDFSVFDADRCCVYRGQFDGSRPGNDVPVTGDTLAEVLDLMLAGQPVPSEGQPPSMGCNIKWKS